MSEDQMSHVPAPESTPEAFQPESGPVSDPDAQDAREARYAEAVYEAKQDGCEVQPYADLTAASQRFWQNVARASAIQVADAELAPLRARVAELEAERDGLWEDVKALAEQVADTRRRAERAEAERDALRQSVEPFASALLNMSTNLRAALAAASPAVSNGEGPTSEAGPVEHLARLVSETADLDYSPSEEGWVCGAHGIPECTQGDCSDLPWPPPNGDDLLGRFADWADGEFRRIVRPYDESDDPDRQMPDDAFLSYSVWEWPVGAFLEAIGLAEARPASPVVAPSATDDGGADRG